MPRRSASDRNQAYGMRFLACLAAVLTLMIVAVHMWPTWPQDRPDIVFHPRESFEITYMVPTHQGAQSPTPPPAPVPIPDRIVLEQPELEFSTAALRLPPTPSDGASAGPRPTKAGATSQAPDVAARALSIVEPVYTEAARQHRIRARVVVEVLVGTDGRVKTARVVECLLLDKKNHPVRRVPHLGYGLEEAALKAARRTRFRPARSAGRPVKSYKRLTIRFGV